MQSTRTPNSRTLRLTRTGDSLALVIREQRGQARQVDAYFLTRTADGYVLSKHDGTRYTVEGNTCSCPGHKYHPGTACRHRAALAKLVELGRL